MSSRTLSTASTPFSSIRRPPVTAASRTVAAIVAVAPIALPPDGRTPAPENRALLIIDTQRGYAVFRGRHPPGLRKNPWERGDISWNLLYTKLVRIDKLLGDVENTRTMIQNRFA